MSHAPDSNVIPKQASKLDFETIAALTGTALTGIWLLLITVNAGPLWRDEVNSINLAVMPIKDLWNNLPFDSCPLLWLLLLRGWAYLGLAESDAGIRAMGLFIGVFFLGSLWLCMRWIGGRSPILSLALLGSLPAFIFTVTSNRAYGLALCLLILTFGALWRVVEFSSRQRIVLAGLLSLLFAHCVYYNAIFLCAMLLGAAVVLVRRRQWKTLSAITMIGAVSMLSMLVYLPIIDRASKYTTMAQASFGIRNLWERIGTALAAHSSAQTPGVAGPEVWIWILLLLVGGAVGIGIQMTRHCGTTQPGKSISTQRDLALFSVVSMLCGMVAYLAFLLNLGVTTSPWYYIEMLTLCAISLDALITVNWPRLSPFGLLRIGFLIVAICWYGRSVWEETHTRRTNVDIIAATLQEKVNKGDLIIVHFAWEGITFERYYTGNARWVTIPQIESHKVHRGDLVWDKMHDLDPMASLLTECTKTLQGGNDVWLVGRVLLFRQGQLPPAPPVPPHPNATYSIDPHGNYWGAKVAAHLLSISAQVHKLTIKPDAPVSAYEDLPVLQFSGSEKVGK